MGETTVSEPETGTRNREDREAHLELGVQVDDIFGVDW